jgi:hypothetical protein
MMHILRVWIFNKIWSMGTCPSGIKNQVNYAPITYANKFQHITSMTIQNVELQCFTHAVMAARMHKLSADASSTANNCKKITSFHNSHSFLATH